MIYNFDELDTFDKVFNKGLQLAKEDEIEAQEFFKQYIDLIIKEQHCDIEKATRIAKSNFGYFAGYYNQEVCDIIYKTYQCFHPIFGNKPFEVDPEEAYKKGLELGNNI